MKSRSQFEQYAEAVQADRYRVTSIKLSDNGGPLVCILDKRNGKTIGFTPPEVIRHLPEMLRLQARGENIYYTPLSESRHHILIDDMDMEKLQQFIGDGYQPAALLESSPGNFQAIITIPKLGIPRDKDVGNRLTERLNREYGDPKLSGCIHPHRAPGFENRKPKHRREDGSFPVVRLLKWARRECAKTLELSRQIDAEQPTQATVTKPLRKPPTAGAGRGVSPPPLGAGGQDACAAYYAHLKDLRQRFGGQDDLSRLDAMIAVRMRITGHHQAAIEDVIYQCAPTIRPSDKGRNWIDYAQRTARYAFSAEGNYQVATLVRYKRQWKELE